MKWVGRPLLLRVEWLHGMKRSNNVMDQSYRSKTYEPFPLSIIHYGWTCAIIIQIVVHVMFQCPPETNTIQENMDFTDRLRDVKILIKLTIFLCDVTSVIFRWKNSSTCTNQYAFSSSSTSTTPTRSAFVGPKLQFIFSFCGLSQISIFFNCFYFPHHSLPKSNLCLRQSI